MKLNIKKRFLNRKLHGQIESFFLFELPRFSRKLFAPFESRAWQNKNEEGRKITRGLSHIKHTIFISSHTHTLFISLPYTHTHTHTHTHTFHLSSENTHTRIFSPVFVSWCPQHFPRLLHTSSAWRLTLGPCTVKLANFEKLYFFKSFFLVCPIWLPLFSLISSMFV